MSEVEALDVRVLLWLNQFMFRWPNLDWVTEWFLYARITQFMPLILAICWLWFEQSERQTFNRARLVETLLVGLVALVFGRVLGLILPFRVRPAFRLDLDFVSPLHETLRTWNSFPSDHAALAFALATSLFRLSPRIGLWALFHSAVIICLPRIYYGLHYPSDIAGGALIGVISVLVFAHLPVRHVVTASFMKVERKYPAMFYTLGLLVLFAIAEMFESLRKVAAVIFSFLIRLLA